MWAQVRRYLDLGDNSYWCPGGRQGAGERDGLGSRGRNRGAGPDWGDPGNAEPEDRKRRCPRQARVWFLFRRAIVLRVFSLAILSLHGWGVPSPQRSFYD